MIYFLLKMLRRDRGQYLLQNVQRVVACFYFFSNPSDDEISIDIHTISSNLHSQSLFKIWWIPFGNVDHVFIQLYKIASRLKNYSYSEKCTSIFLLTIPCQIHLYTTYVGGCCSYFSPCFYGNMFLRVNVSFVESRRDVILIYVNSWATIIVYVSVLIIPWQYYSLTLHLYLNVQIVFLIRFVTVFCCCGL